MTPFNQFPEHRINWKIPNKVRQEKIHEAYYVLCMRPTGVNLFDTFPKWGHLGKCF